MSAKISLISLWPAHPCVKIYIKGRVLARRGAFVLFARENVYFVTLCQKCLLFFLGSDKFLKYVFKNEMN